MSGLVGTTCHHIRDELQSQGDDLKARYRTVLTWGVHRSQAIRATPKRRKIAAPSCGVCGLALSRAFACLQCEFAGCWTDGHAVEHLHDADHLFCVDIKTGAIYCAQCDDFIYDSTMEEFCTDVLVEAEEKQTRFQVSQKLRDNFKRWVPDDKAKTALENFTPLPCQARRGLVNLGQTCFLNAVLQCFVHNPLLRNYFLSDKHNWRQCKIEHCTCCEMDRLFTEIYSPPPPSVPSTMSGSPLSLSLQSPLPPPPPPYAPTSFLHTLYKSSTELSSYAQHDAHETHISLLNAIHATSRGSTNVSCNCVVHGVFGGQLQSDVRCEKCGGTNTAVDPMLDVSLELGGVGGSGGSQGGGEVTLAACLRRFTQPEKLGAKDYTCTKCGKVTHEASKRMSIRQLPAVLSFQFKRFEQKTNDKSSARKLDTHVRIPASINMAPYTSSVVRDMDKENNHSGGSGPVPFLYPGPEVLYEYDLFAVINHEGQIDNGHYTNYARFGDEWYRFDDDKVTHATLADGLSSNPYMCFYVKRHLDYKPHVIPTYVLIQKNEAQKEKEREATKDRDGSSARGASPSTFSASGASTAPAPSLKDSSVGKDTKDRDRLKELRDARERERERDAREQRMREQQQGSQMEVEDHGSMNEIDDELLATV